MALDAEGRRRTWAQLMRSADLGSVSITKADLRAAVDATDDWIEANSASYNQALPQPARSSLTADQKTLVFVYVALRRRGLLTAEED